MPLYVSGFSLFTLCMLYSNMKLSGSLIMEYIAIIVILWFIFMNRNNKISNLTQMKSKTFKVGMLLFILSEVMLFFSFFWSFINYTLTVEMESSVMETVMKMESLSIPLMNTLLLLSSGMTSTVSHLSVLENKKVKSLVYLMGTLVLGVVFIYNQIQEYFFSNFSMSDSSASSMFFMATGFHGAHVLLGAMMLSWSIIRITLNQMNYLQMESFEMSLWYWHFVDVVWLVLFSLFYLWMFGI